MAILLITVSRAEMVYMGAVLWVALKAKVYVHCYYAPHAGGVQVACSGYKYRHSGNLGRNFCAVYSIFHNAFVLTMSRGDA